MSRIRQLLIRNAGSFLLVVLLALSSELYLGSGKEYINADGSGYYEYLPALFIYHNLPQAQDSVNGNFPSRTNELGAYNNYRNTRINKYSAGTALLMSPFFAVAHTWCRLTGQASDGFSFPYQLAIRIAALFYLMLALVAMKELFLLFGFREPEIFLSQILLTGATSILYYATREPAYSHIYSFFTINVFYLLVKRWLHFRKTGSFYRAAFFFGLLILIRPVNVIALLFIPFLAEENMLNFRSIGHFFPSLSGCAKAIAIILSVYSIQVALNYYQTGHLIVDAYVDEHFYFRKPHFTDILFSFRKGLFVYAPVLFISLGGLMAGFRNGNPKRTIYWLLFFIFISYIFSSWQSWEYGCTFGSRVYIDYYLIFFILWISAYRYFKHGMKLFFVIISFLMIPLSFIQTYQVKNYILDCFLQGREQYFRFFLRTGKQFEGMCCKATYNLNGTGSSVVKEKILPDSAFAPHSNCDYQVIYSSSIPDFDSVNLIQVSLRHHFPSGLKSFIELNIRDSAGGNIRFFNSIYMMRFLEGDFNEMQTGVYYFKTGSMSGLPVQRIAFRVISEEDPVTLHQFKVRFINYREESP